MPLVQIKSDPRAREKPCIRCGYSLRKVTDSPHCPECGLAVWLSLNPNDALDISNPEWLRRGAVALRVMAAACLLAVAALIPPIADDYAFMQFRHQREAAIREAMFDGDEDSPKWSAVYAIRPPRPNFSALRAAQIAGAAALAVFLVGLFLLTTPEGRYPDRLAPHRVAARILCAAGGLAIFLMVFNVLRNEPPTTGFGRTLARLTFLLAAVVAWAHLRHVARRGLNRQLARVATWMTFIPLAALFYGFIRNSGWLPDFITPLHALASAALFVRFALLLKRDASLAEKHWSTGASPVAQPA